MQGVFDFLGARTPQLWFEQAVTQMPTLLIDHANCEKKAAATALNLMFRYVDRHDLLVKMSQLAREELLHFEQVVQMMQKLGVDYVHLSPASYAASLHAQIDKQEPNRLVDTLIVGAFIEARSCERFHGLAATLKELEPYQEVASYYRFLLKSESRHFEDYLALAEQYAQGSIEPRVQKFREIEAELMGTPSTEAFRFHTGPMRSALKCSNTKTVATLVC